MTEFHRGKLYVSKVADIPEGEYWIALSNESVHIPGDERSRTNPGHGYPAHTENYFSMIVFEDAEAMKRWVQKQNGTYLRDNYKILYIRTPRVTTRVEVQVDVD